MTSEQAFRPNLEQVSLIPYLFLTMVRLRLTVDYCRLLVFKADGKQMLAFRASFNLREPSKPKRKTENLVPIRSQHYFYAV
jgi:hypothetical protein